MIWNDSVLDFHIFGWGLASLHHRDGFVGRSARHRRGGVGRIDERAGLAEGDGKRLLDGSQAGDPLLLTLTLKTVSIAGAEVQLFRYS